MSEKQVYDVLADFADALESCGVQLKQALARYHGVALDEGPFLNLVWTETFGGKVGRFQYSTLDENNEDVFHRCVNILRQNRATINNQFGEKNWQHRYWLWKERANTIYRKRRSK